MAEAFEDLAHYNRVGAELSQDVRDMNAVQVADLVVEASHTPGNQFGNGRVDAMAAAIPTAVQSMTDAVSAFAATAFVKLKAGK